MKTESLYLNKAQQNDNVNAKVEILPTSDFYGGRDVASKMAQTIISNDRVVHTCSPTYGLLKNESFFGKMEEQLNAENLQYKVRSFNHNDSRFSVDYILNDDNKQIIVNDQKNNGVDDTIVPMIRLTNSYDGSAKTAGYLGFFRKVCHNGLHMATTQMEFKIKHTVGNMEVFIPNIEELMKRFLDNELFSITDKIQKMKTHFIDEKHLDQWIKQLAKEEKVWVDEGEKRYFKRLQEAQDKGLDISKVRPAHQSKNIDEVKGILLRDANNTGVEPNAWLVYSAFNEYIHAKVNNTFEKQKDIDTRVFNNVSNLVY